MAKIKITFSCIASPEIEEFLDRFGIIDKDKELDNKPDDEPVKDCVRKQRRVPGHCSGLEFRRESKIRDRKHYLEVKALKKQRV